MLATNGVKSFVIFLYADGEIQWTTGDRSGGTEALAGINAGDGKNFVTIPGSLTPKIISITQTSNVGNPGVWIFRVDHGTKYMFYTLVTVVTSANINNCDCINKNRSSSQYVSVEKCCF